MDSDFSDQNKKQQEPSAVTRFEELKVEPWDDKSRLTIKVLLSPFQQRPSLRLKICNLQGEKIVETTIIETMDTAFELTMHLPKQIGSGQFFLQGNVFYENEESIDQMITQFEV